MKILFASSNKGKINEVQEAASALPITVLSPEEAMVAGLARNKQAPDVEESASSYEGNARLKVDAYYEWSGIPALADDAGLEVQALDGAPGLFSARYAGVHGDWQRNTAKLLDALKDTKNRRAFFRCCLVLKLGPFDYIVTDGRLEGEIAQSPAGTGGFGYDNVFIVKGTGRTLAQLKEDTCGTVPTHRTEALGKLVEALKVRLE
jgi:XTP/dITP diphosphohydrolase